MTIRSGSSLPPAAPTRTHSTESASDRPETRTTAAAPLADTSQPNVETSEGRSSQGPTPVTAQAAREVSNAGVALLQASLHQSVPERTSAQPSTAQAEPEEVNGLSREAAADFSLISADRQEDLRGKAQSEFIDIYAHGDTHRVDGKEVPQLDYVDLRNILTDLKGRTDMTDIEKAFVWSEIADAKGVGGNFGYQDAELHIDNRGVQSDLIDDGLLGGLVNREWNTPSHTVVPFHDPVHGFGELSPGRYIGYAYDDIDEATQRIEEAESDWKGNQGDVNASIAATRAFHAWRDADSGERFEAFADTWISEIVDPAYQ